MVRRETTERNDDPWLDSKDLDSARDTLDGYTLDGYTLDGYTLGSRNDR